MRVRRDEVGASVVQTKSIDGVCIRFADRRLEGNLQLRQATRDGVGARRAAPRSIPVDATFNGRLKLHSKYFRFEFEKKNE